MGCSTTCAGYELRNDLNFDTDGDGDVDASDPGSYPNWTPIGGSYTTVFEGNNRTIFNLTMNTSSHAGLFHSLSASSTVRSVGLAGVNVTITGTGSAYVGALARRSFGTVIGVWSSGSLVGGAGDFIGGLLGYTEGRLAASHSSAATTGFAVGGLAGQAAGQIVASFATGAVTGNTASGHAGGLVGLISGTSTIQASYFAGLATSTVSSASVGGLVGADIGYRPGTTGLDNQNSYFSSDTTGLTGSDAQTTSALQTPISATGIYAQWTNLDVDGDGTAGESPWSFGTSSEYPALSYAGLDLVVQRGDYDLDDDGLVDVYSLVQLNAIRWDLDGDGAVGAGNRASYRAAFVNHRADMGCPAACTGYELMNDLDFDTDSDGDVDSSDGYPNWTPIGRNYNANFNGNYHTISNLTASGDTEQGLFAVLGIAGGTTVSNLGLVNVAVSATSGTAKAGALAGVNWATVTGVYVRGGTVSATPALAPARTGGLVGHHRDGIVQACYATAAVSGSSNTEAHVGGLVGESNYPVTTSYATGMVADSGSGNARLGGLIGTHRFTFARITNTYATGAITRASTASDPRVGGLVGLQNSNNQSVVASYWDTQTTLQASSAMGTAQTTSGLQGPTRYTGIYADWNVDLDSDSSPDDPWHFGWSNQYPVLKWGGHSAAAQFALQPDTAPAFATSTPLAAMTFPAGVAIRPFQLPEVTAGNGAYVYTPSGLPAGLSLGTPNCASERTVCGTPSAATSATVTVTVADSDSNEEAGDRDTVTFTITVRADEPDSEEPANRAPEAASALSDATLAVGETLRVSLAAAFRDPDGDALAYSAAASNPAVASASVANAALVLQGVADGVATVTATDPGNLSVSQTLTATVGTVLTVVGGGAPATGAPSVPEGGTLRLDVRLSMPRREPTAFTWRVLADADPATADADAGEHGDASGTATIAAAATSTEIAIAIADDADVEPAREWFVVEIASDAVALARSRLSAAVLEGVCDRSAATAAALAGERSCEAPTPAELAGVRVLEMDQRGIEALDPDDLAGLEGLQALLLRGNDLTALPAGLLRSAPTLRWLRLDGNRLAALDEDAFAGLAELRELDLSDNALEELPGGLFAGVGSLRSAFLADNPGAPFALSVELRRTDAAAGEAGPATIRAELAAGAPFAVEVGLTANNAELAAADGSAFEDGAASLAAGDTFGSSVLATSRGVGAAQVSAMVGRMPETICDGAPCWTGLELSAGPPLVLFWAPPLAQPAPAPDPLFGDDLRLPLQSLIDAGDSAAPSWRASSSDPSVAAARIRGGELVVEPAPGAEGVVEIEVEAVDEHGQSATLRFVVEVEFHWPPRVGAGWRSVLGASP